MPDRKYFIITLISMSLIGLELTWTRIFSAEFFYTFAFLILSLAILGLGLGALALRLIPKLHSDNVFAISAFLCGLTAIIGPPLVFLTGVDFDKLFESFGMLMNLLIVIIILNLPYFFGGIVISGIFKSDPEKMPRLYMSDLIGSGIGVLVAVIIMNTLGTPVATVLSGVPVTIAVLLAVRKPIHKVMPAILALSMIILGINSNSLLEVKGKDKAKVLLTHWDAMSKVKVLDYHPRVKGIMVDNKAGSNVLKFSGNLNNEAEKQIDFGINAGNIFKRYNSCRFLSVGAGGGMDVLQALFEGAAEIHAVEINSYINFMLTDGYLSDFSGNIYKNPKVKVISDDARAYIRRFDNYFDFIFSRSANSYAALASGAYALAENYLFTEEAIGDMYKALTDSGIVLIEHKTYIPRTVNMTLNALKKMGVDSPEKHICVYDARHLNGQILLISKRPMDSEFIHNALKSNKSTTPGSISVLYPEPQNNNLISVIINGGIDKASETATIDISSCTDDRPFVAQTGLWKNFSFEKLSDVEVLDEYRGFPLSKLSTLIILLVVTIVIIPLNIIPYLSKGKKLGFSSWLFYFFLGIAFMSVEVILIQKYTLLIGPSVYSIITILMVLLTASGIGSNYSGKFSLTAVYSGIFIFLMADIFLFGELFYLIAKWDITFRILMTGILLFPLGFFMGMPFPKAGKKAGELIDWGFAVNGAGSVFGATFIVLAAINFGFRYSLIISICFYLMAFLLQRKNVD